MNKHQLMSKVREAEEALSRLLASRGNRKAAEQKELRESLAELEVIKGTLASGKKVNAAELIIRVYIVLDRLISWLNK